MGDGAMESALATYYSESNQEMSVDQGRWLSKKQIAPQDRLIFALDTQDGDEARALVERLGDTVHFYKLGLELFIAGQIPELLPWLSDRGKKCLVDLKFFDVPRTVGAAVRRLRETGADFATVHGNDDILKAACDESNGMKILAVTVLTSLDQADLDELGFQVSVEEVVLSRAKRALKIGCDGVISSGLEADRLRETLGENFLIVVPGIRPVENRESDDQVRTVDVEDAFKKGADYIVVGRPIRNAPDPEKAAADMQERIRQLFAS
jgi:orotidine-5'-phosphate decarboxylase